MNRKRDETKKSGCDVLKKITLLCAVFLLCIAVLPAAVSAETINADYSWYGDGSSHYFTISDVYDLIGFANIVNGVAEGIQKDAFEGKTVRLTNDIDLTGKVWTPIGSSMYDHSPTKDTTKMFAGTFDGCGHTIIGLSDSEYSLLDADAGTSKEYSFGLFGYVYGANIANVNLSDVNINACERTKSDGATKVHGSGVAALVGYYVPKPDMASVIENCHVLGGSVTASNNMGGLIGYMKVMEKGETVDVTIRDCSNKADVTTDAREAGGILGLSQLGHEFTSAVLKFEYCKNAGDITANTGGDCSVAGGILGQENTDPYPYDNCKKFRIFFTGCENSGTITANGKSDAEVHAAGMGTSYSTRDPWLIADNCKNSGEIKITGGDNLFAGGIFAHSTYATIINCENSGTITVPTGANSGDYIGKIYNWVFLNSESVNDVSGGIKCILNGGKTIYPMPKITESDINDYYNKYTYAGLPTPDKEGYVFDGWYTSSDFSGEKLDWNYITENTETYYAKWVDGIDFNANGGVGDMNPQEFTEGNAVTLNPNTFTRDNYRFAGWAKSYDGDVEYEDKADISVTEKTILYAQWESVITFNSNDGAGDMSEMAIGYGKSENLKPNTFTLSDYEFAGWAESEDGDVVYTDEELITPTGNITLYAQWKGAITFDANGGSGEMKPEEILKGSTVTLTPNTFTYTGHLFNNWNTKPDNTGTSYEDKETVPSAENIVLYANWTECNDHTFTKEIATSDYLKSSATYTQKAVYYKSCAECGISSKGIDEDATFEHGDVLEEAPDTNYRGGSSSEGTYTTMTRDAPKDGGEVFFKNSASMVESVSVPAGIVDGKIVVSAVTNADVPEGKEVEELFEVNIIGNYPAGKESVITVSLPKSELNKRGLTEADACIYHFDGGKWEKLTTTYEVNGDSIIYHGTTTSFSPFALVYEIGGAVPKENEEPVDEPTEQPPEDIPLEPLPPIVDIPTETPETPMPIVGLLAGIGCAAVLFRRK